MGDLMTCQIHRNILVSPGVRLFFSLEKILYPQLKFSKIKWFGQIIISTMTKSCLLVLYLWPSRLQNHEGITMCFDPQTQVHRIAIWEHPIQYCNIVETIFKQCISRCNSLTSINLMTIKILLDIGSNFGLIFEQENMSHNLCDKDPR